jgi:hypothetical protein
MCYTCIYIEELRKTTKNLSEQSLCQELRTGPAEIEVGKITVQASACSKVEFQLRIAVKLNMMGGPGSSVCIATDYGRSGIESRWGRDFPPFQTGPGAHPASCKMGTGSFPGVKCGWGMLLTTHPLLVPRSWKRELYLYPPSGPHQQACNGITKYDSMLA